MLGAQGLRIAALNVGAIGGKPAELVRIIENQNIDVCVITETWLREWQGISGSDYIVIYFNKYLDPNYLGRGQGGIAFVVHPRFRGRVREIGCDSANSDWATIEIDGTRICGIYFSPSYTPTQFRASLLSAASSVQNGFMIGDFNARIGPAVGDTIRNAKGTVLLNWIIGSDSTRLNPESGSWTYEVIGGRSIIDYAIARGPARALSTRFSIDEHGSWCGTDHNALILELESFSSQNRPMEFHAFVWQSTS